jgi:RNA polymerase sigma-70 factor (ECF subfamily)
MPGDRRAPEERFTYLFDAHYSAVRAYAWRRGPDSADDVVAETFTIAWQRLDSVPAEDPLPWLIGIARNVRLNLLRAERRRCEREMRSVESAAVPSLAGAVEARASLRAALQQVSERDREILLLTAWESLDRGALAAALGCSKATAAVRLFRARKRLTAALADAEAWPAQSPVVPREPEGSLLDES